MVFSAGEAMIEPGWRLTSAHLQVGPPTLARSPSVHHHAGNRSHSMTRARSREPARVGASAYFPRTGDPVVQEPIGEACICIAVPSRGMPAYREFWNRTVYEHCSLYLERNVGGELECFHGANAHAPAGTEWAMLQAYGWPFEGYMVSVLVSRTDHVTWHAAGIGGPPEDRCLAATTPLVSGIAHREDTPVALQPMANCVECLLRNPQTMLPRPGLEIPPDWNQTARFGPRFEQTVEVVLIDNTIERAAPALVTRAPMRRERTPIGARAPGAGGLGGAPEADHTPATGRSRPSMASTPPAAQRRGPSARTRSWSPARCFTQTHVVAGLPRFAGVLMDNGDYAEINVAGQCLPWTGHGGSSVPQKHFGRSVGWQVPERLRHLPRPRPPGT
jgi:hypothetical protein